MLTPPIMITTVCKINTWNKKYFINNLMKECYQIDKTIINIFLIKNMFKMKENRNNPLLAIKSY